MRVPTLNPASFGKLVRIIFPNVQTRRLGVRGESKYHYVDLSLNDGDDEQYATSFDRPPTGTGMNQERRGSILGASKPSMARMPSQSERPASRMTMETADFPAPRMLSKPTAIAEPDDDDSDGTPEPEVYVKQPPRLDCKYINTATIRIPVRGKNKALLDVLPSVRAGMPGTMSTYTGMPTLNMLAPPSISSQESAFEVPDIAMYLAGEAHDPLMAQALTSLYRSYCTDVIDAFRKCKEKPFFNHYSAFNGKMTVPISKLFNLPCLAPWIHECDMRMYKQMVRFIAPLALQNVPEMVWGVFERISTRLVPHILAIFEEKSPLHVVVSKSVPAARFANLLKRLRDANAATLQLSKMLEDSQARTQMWLDLMVMVEPDRLLEDSMPPPESFVQVQGILKQDIRTLIEPIEGGLVANAEDDTASAYANFLADINQVRPINIFGCLNLANLRSNTSLLDKWIAWLESLPKAFPGHHAQCMMDWHTKFWRSLMMQVGQGGALSYQSWWYAESFASQILAWMCEMQGMLMPEEDQKEIDKLDEEKKAEALALRSTIPILGKRKRTSDVNDEPVEEERTRKQGTPSIPTLSQSEKRADSTQQQEESEAAEEPTLPEMPENTQPDHETDEDMDEITGGGPLELPSIHTGLTSPVKLQPTQGNINHRAGNMAKHIMQNHNNGMDDSGIALEADDDDHDEGMREARKFNKRDWLLSSDPVDVQGVGLGVTA